MATTGEAILLGALEGLTEFLPVSSTGHLVLASHALGMEPKAADNFAIVVQFGALVAVMLYYRERVGTLVRGALGKDENGRRLLLLLLAAFFPAAIIGLLAGKFIEARLFGATPVAIALIVGGVAMIIAERAGKNVKNYPIPSLDQATWKDALFVGVIQCLALWPGMSRSMTTIVGAQLRGFSGLAAAEFSFLLAMPTLGAATIYKFAGSYAEMAKSEGALTQLLIGNIVSFAVAFLAVSVFIRMVAKVGMTPFGIYRILLGIVVLVLVRA